MTYQVIQWMAAEVIFIVFFQNLTLLFISDILLKDTTMLL